MTKTIAFIVLLFVSTNNYAQKVETYKILNNVQFQIDKSFIEAFIKNSTSALDSIYMDIEMITEKSKSKSKTLNYYTRYWKSYIKYKSSIYHLKNGDYEVSKKMIADAIKIIEYIDEKDSEIYSLLALEQSFNFQFIPRQEFMVYMNKISNNLEYALKLGRDNLRSYYVNASYDYYTPKEYGGGVKCENYLLKAISLFDKKPYSSFSPYWGKELSYDLLIKYYIREKDKKKARKYFDIANKLYPKSLLIPKNINAISAIDK